MISVACFALLAVVVGVAPVAALLARDKRDEKRRSDRLRLWYEKQRRRVTTGATREN